MIAVDDDDCVSTEPLGEEGELYIGAVLVAVADEQCVLGIKQREGDQQFGLTAGFEADAERSAKLDDLFDDAGLLVHFDRIDAPPLPLVFMLGDRFQKAGRQSLYARRENVGEADQHRATKPAPL